MAKSKDPVFSLPNGKCITYSKFQSKLREWISKLQMNPDLYSSHSFRRGGSTWAFESGVPSDLIQFQGDWQSDAYKKYLTFSLHDKVQVGMKRKQHILIRKTCPCIVYPLEPHFCIEKLGYVGIYLFFLCLLQNKDFR